jgi:hypothetical protein
MKHLPKQADGWMAFKVPAIKMTPEVSVQLLGRNLTRLPIWQLLLERGNLE